MEDSRPVLKCEQCLLVQFKTQNGKCRRCNAKLWSDPEPPPEPVVVKQSRATEEFRRVGNNIKIIREQLGIKRGTLASKMGSSPQNFCRLENSQKTNYYPSIGFLERIAGFLSVSMRCLFDPSAEEFLLHDNYIMEIATNYLPNLTPAKRRAILETLRKYSESTNGHKKF